MKSFAQCLLLKNDPKLIEEYKVAHAKVWPEVLKALNAIGINRMKIYLLGNKLFMYFETKDDFDAKRDFLKYTQLTPKASEWDNLMRNYQEPVPEADTQAGEWWASMQEVFDMESQLAAL